MTVRDLQLLQATERALQRMATQQNTTTVLTRPSSTHAHIQDPVSGSKAFHRHYTAINLVL
jgi:hypothetical protein